MKYISDTLITVLFAVVVLFLIDKIMRFIVILLTEYVNYDEEKTMEFRKFNDLLNQHFKEMAKCGQLFFVSVDKDEMWNLYLDSFPAGTNNIF